MSQIREIPAGQLRSDPKVQRNLDPIWRTALLADFRRDQMGTLSGSQRGDDDIYLMDGQHRHSVIMEKFGPDELVRVEVFEHLNLAQEAEISLRLNDRRNWSFLATFRVRVTAGDLVAVELDELIRTAGWQLPTTTNPGPYRLHAVSALEGVYLGRGVRKAAGKHAVEVVATLTTLGESFGYRTESVHATLIKGLGLFYTVNGVAKQDGVIRALKHFDSSQALLGQASLWSSTRGWDKSNAVAGIITDRYNVKKQDQHKLPYWLGR